MKIIVFGLENEDTLLPRLRKAFPSIGFLRYGKSVELEEEGPDLLVLDSVNGVEEVGLIDDLDSLSPGRALAASEMMMTLRIMVKIGSIKSVRMIAVPTGMGQEEAFEGICRAIRSLP